MIVIDILQYIESKTTSYAQIQVDVLEDGEAISIRQLPSNNNITRYMDGSRAGEFDFAMIAKSDDRQKAIDQLEIYEGILDLPEFFCLEDQSSVKIEPLNDIRFDSINLDNRTVYTNTFRCEYVKERT